VFFRPQVFIRYFRHYTSTSRQNLSLVTSLCLLLSASLHADIGERVDNDFTLTGLVLKHKLTSDFEVELKAVALSEHLSDGYASVGAIKNLSNSVKWKIEYFELFPEPTNTRSNPRDQRIRSSLTKLWATDNWLLVASQLVEYQNTDYGNGWRYRPSGGIYYTGTLFGLTLRPQLKGELFYDEGANDHTFSVLNAGITIPIAAGLSLDTGIYRVHTHQDDRIYNGLQFMATQRF